VGWCAIGASEECGTMITTSDELEIRSAVIRG
jgi:hypothetical protein